MRVGIAIDDLVLDDFEIDGRRLAPLDREIGGSRRDGLAPARKRAVAAERGQRAEDLEERVLDQILELAVVAEDAKQRVVDGLLEAVEQLALGGTVAVRG